MRIHCVHQRLTCTKRAAFSHFNELFMDMPGLLCVQDVKLTSASLKASFSNFVHACYAAFVTAASPLSVYTRPFFKSHGVRQSGVLILKVLDTWVYLALLKINLNQSRINFLADFNEVVLVPQSCKTHNFLLYVRIFY